MMKCRMLYCLALASAFVAASCISSTGILKTGTDILKTSKPPVTKGIYGFSKNSPLFKGMTKDQIAAWLQDHGINAVWGGYEDKELVDALHQAGIKVYAEMPCFAGDVWLKKYPESHPINADGKVIDRIDWYRGVCPHNIRIRYELKEAFKRLATQYEIDGIWLDFLRYPCHWEVRNPKVEQTCFGPDCLEDFQKDTGIAIPADKATIADAAHWILANHQKEWTKWKCDQITSFAQELKAELKAARPNAVLGLFSVPWMPSDHDDAIDKIICQDYVALAPHFDVFSPMCYHQMTGRDPAWIARVTNWMATATRKPVWPIVQMGGPVVAGKVQPFTDAEISQIISAGLSGKSQGICLFRFGDLIRDQKLDLVREEFR